jgi:hypothetical protein
MSVVTGTASGQLNTSRQMGGALAVAVFGALLPPGPRLRSGFRVSLAIAATVALPPPPPAGSSTPRQMRRQPMLSPG